jgi:hypothetical protein
MHKSLTQTDEALPGAWLTPINSAISTWIARIDMRWWIGLSFAFSLAVLASTGTTTGDFIGGYTDHLHHARAAWTFLYAGWDVFARPFGKVGMEVPYPQVGLFWPDWPIPYPIGMLGVFMPIGIIGRFIPMDGMLWGKVIILYLLVITHAALWIVASLLRRRNAAHLTLPLVMIWFFYIRLTLMGFYDGAWLLPGALALIQMNKGRTASALMLFTTSAFISYRGAAFLPMALVALRRFFIQDYPAKKRLLVLGFCSVICGLIVMTFWALNKHSPDADGLRRGVDSPLLAFTTRTYFVIVIGVASSLYLARVEGLLVGSSAAVATLLSVLHGGHSWHGTVCVPALLSFALKDRSTTRGAILAVLFVALTWQLAFYFAPFQFIEELIKFIDRPAVAQ